MIEIEEKSEEIIEEAYDIFNRVWTEHEYCKTYEDFVEETEIENEFLKEHFDEFVERMEDWSVRTFLKIVNFMHPEAKASIVEADTIYLEW